MPPFRVPPPFRASPTTAGEPVPSGPERFRPRRVPVLRGKLPRSALAYWAACLVLACLTALAVGGTIARAGRAERRYGHTRPVVVATAGIEPGRPVNARNVGVQQWPAGLVPPGSLTAVPHGRVALVAIEAGEPVAARRTSGSGRSGPAGLMPRGSRAVAVPLPVAGLPLAAGDRVDLVPAGAPADGSTGARAEGGRPVAADAVVIAVTAQTVTVAVRADELGRVATALGQGGGVVVGLHPPGG